MGLGVGGGGGGGGSPEPNSILILMSQWFAYQLACDVSAYLQKPGPRTALDSLSSPAGRIQTFPLPHS